MMIKKIAALAAGLWLSIGCAFAQTSPNLTYGQVLTPAQWNQLFINKNDTLGYTPLNVAGGVMTGRLVTAPASSAASGFNLTCSTTVPASPSNGDQWCTSAGMFIEINGITIGPLSGATSSSFANTSPITLSFPSGIVTYACPTCGVTGSPLSQFAATTSAQLLGIISDETGTGLVMGNNGPTMIAPILGAATATSINKVAITAPATSATLTIANGKTLTATNSVNFTGTDGSSVAFGAGGTIAYTSNNLSVFASTTSAQLAGVLSDETGSGLAVFATSPTLVTPALGVAAATSLAIGGATIGSNGLAVTGTALFNSAINYGGVALSNSVTGTGSMVLSVGPTITSSFTATGLVTFADMATTAISTQANYFAGASNVLVPASQIYQPEITITFAAAQTIDFSMFVNSAITLTANMTSMTLSNVVAGKAGQIRLIQDGTGSRLFTGTWPTIFKWPSGIQPTLSTAAGAVDEIEFNCSSATYCTASFLPNVH